MRRPRCIRNGSTRADLVAQREAWTSYPDHDDPGEVRFKLQQDEALLATLPLPERTDRPHDPKKGGRRLGVLLSDDRSAATLTMGTDRCPELSIVVPMGRMRLPKVHTWLSGARPGAVVWAAAARRRAVALIDAALRSAHVVPVEPEDAAAVEDDVRSTMELVAALAGGDPANGGTCAPAAPWSRAWLLPDGSGRASALDPDLAALVARRLPPLYRIHWSLAYGASRIRFDDASLRYGTMDALEAMRAARELGWVR